MSSTMGILNRISKSLLVMIIITGCIYFGYTLFKEEPHKVYNFTELITTYKNCVVVGKTEVHDVPKLYLMNPYISRGGYNMIDYTVYVTRVVYNNTFIGDTIGKTKQTFIRSD